MPKLNLGCGSKIMKDAINLDLRCTQGVDVVADASRLPFRDGNFDTLLAFDVLEHFGRNEINNVLSEWRRVLSRMGELRIKTPNLVMIILRWQKGEFPDLEAVRLLYGMQDYPENLHRCGFTPGLLYQALQSAGFNDIEITKLDGNDKNNMFVRARK